MSRKSKSGKAPVDTYFSDVKAAAHNWLLKNDLAYQKSFTRNSAENLARLQTARLLKSQVTTETDLQSSI